MSDPVMFYGTLEQLNELYASREYGYANGARRSFRNEYPEFRIWLGPRTLSEITRKGFDGIVEMEFHNVFFIFGYYSGIPIVLDGEK